MDARNNLVAVARANNVPKNWGGVDAIVFAYDAAAHVFAPLHVIGTEVRGRTAAETPISVALTEDGSGLYIGYSGELAYVSLDNPQAPALSNALGLAMDIAVSGDAAYVAVTDVDWPWVDVSMLSRARVVTNTLAAEPLLTTKGFSAGGAVKIDQDVMCFGTWSTARYENGYNLWVFTNLLGGAPARAGAAGTLDWIYQLACRDAPTGPDRVYVADEWGGLEVWQSDSITLTLNLAQDRAATGALSFGVWHDGARVFAAKKGGGLWFFDESDPRNEQVAVEWIDRSDPGCQCAGCCPPATGARPYPPAVFVVAGTSNQGRLILFTQDRNTAVEGDGYLMVFAENQQKGRYENVCSEPIAATPAGGRTAGGHTVRAEGEMLFVSSSTPTLRLYQHCPAESDSVRFLTEIALPAPENNREISDAAVYQDYLFLTEVHKPLLQPEQSGVIHVYQWKQGALAQCPAQPSLLSPPVYLGSFAADYIPFRLLVDVTRDRLIVGGVSNLTQPGRLRFYDLGQFNPATPADMDNHYTDVTPDDTLRVTDATIYDLLVDGDSLLLVDFDNGLYEYSFLQGIYTRFYPAHRGPMSQVLAPQLVQSPEGVIPLFHPVAVTLMPSGQIMVQEHISGRVSIFSWLYQVYLPLLQIRR